jgi:hypothetical protein
MPIPFAITAISISYPDIAENYYNNNLSKRIFLLIGIFYHTGADPTYPPISRQRLRCSQFTGLGWVGSMGHFLAHPLM